jgi:hypothetical protein
MNLKRAATIAVVGGACAAWLAADTMSSVRDSDARPVADAQPIDARAESLAQEIARLHERLRPDATPRLPGRNPFRFGDRSPEARLAANPPSEPVAPIAQPARPPLPLRLSGLAEDAGPDGPVRTAIISGLGQLFLVKEGETVTPRYRVIKIGEDAVELVDSIDGTTLRLALK